MRNTVWRSVGSGNMSLKLRWVTPAPALAPSCLLGHRVCPAQRVKFPSWMSPWRDWFPSGNCGTAQGSSNLPFHSKISTKAPEPPAGCSTAPLGTAALGQKGGEKKSPRGGYRATDVPWRTRNKEKEQQPSGREAEHSAKLEMGWPGASVAALCQGPCLFCPCFICPRVNWGTFFSPVINLQVPRVLSSLNNLGFFANVCFELAVSAH